MSRSYLRTLDVLLLEFNTQSIECVADSLRHRVWGGGFCGELALRPCFAIAGERKSEIRGESQLLEELYTRGMAQPLVAPISTLVMVC